MMLRTLLICAAACVCAACSTTSPRPDTKTAAAGAQPACVTDSASRLPAKPGECSAFPGRSYSEADLDRTGKTDVGDALQLLDPSITVHH